MNPEPDAALQSSLRDVDSIQNIDAARMTLRWALERMRVLEKRAEELAGDAARAEKARAKTSSELEAAQELLSRRVNEALERERYYAKIEEYLSLKLEGALDAACLAKREARVEAREEDLQRREIDGERALKAAQIRRDDDLKAALSSAETSAQHQLGEARADYDRRLDALKRDVSLREVALHEKQAQLASMERTLEERRKRFEEFHAAQRAALEREAASINQASRDQAEFLERRIELALAAKSKALESAWQADKQALMAELAEWRAKAREHLPALLQAQSAAASLEDSLRRLDAEKKTLEQAKAALAEELEEWRAPARDERPALLAAVRRAVQAEETVQHLEVELAAARRRAEEHLAETLAQQLTEETRRQELSKMESAISARLRESEQNLFRQYDAWQKREEDLRLRDQDWTRQAEERQASTEMLRAELLTLREELKKAVAAYRAKTASEPALSDRGLEGTS